MGFKPDFDPIHMPATPERRRLSLCCDCKYKGNISVTFNNQEYWFGEDDELYYAIIDLCEAYFTNKPYRFEPMRSTIG